MIEASPKVVPMLPMGDCKTTVTPDLAKQWLAPDINRGNRTINKRWVARLTEMMAAGKWLYNGDPIRFSKTGRLLDGQHRLAACVCSGVSFVVRVVTGIDEEAFATIDAGRKRVAADFIDCPHAAVTAAAIRWLVAYETGAWWLKHAVTNADVLTYFKKHPEVVEAPTIIGAKFHGGVPLSILAAAYVIFARIDNDAARRFFADLLSGAGLEADDPVWVLRERLVRRSARSAAKQTHEEIMTVVIRAWNARRRGKNPTLLVGVSKSGEIVRAR